MIESLTNPRRLVTAGALVAPLVGVQIIRLFFGSSAGPSMSAAATMMPSSTEPPMQTAIAPAISAHDRSVAEWLNTLSRADKLESPMEFVPVLPVDARPTAAAPAEPAPVIKQGEDTIPAAMRLPVNLTLGAILGSNETALAMIGGKVRRVGDTLFPGWTVTSISPREQTVTITGPNDATIELTPERRPAPNE